MYDNILYPTDGSAGSEAAAAHVRELASAFGATVHVLHVVDTPEGGLGTSGAFLDEDRKGMSGESAEEGYLGGHEGKPDADEIEERLTEHVTGLMERSSGSFDGIDLRTVVRHGDPHSAILEYADENDVDLVVMGTSGRAGVESDLLGSVTEKVVRMSDPPVVTVRADETE